MKLPLSWIKEFVHFEESEEEIAHLLTMAGLEVEEIQNQELPFENVVVGKVTATEPHPEASQLCVAQVFDGENSHQVVCGAPNCREGLTTAFGMVGAKLQDETGKTLKIKKAKLRGVESFGMLCSGKELGLSDDAEGIIELPDTLHPGTSLRTLYGDTLLDIALTPNLAHCFSALGVARELGAILGRKVKLPTIPPLNETGKDIASLTSVAIHDRKKCPRYACRLIQGIKVGPSPIWLKQRVEGCGMRSINNIVDITNFVMMEWGHPLHAFDFDLLEGGAIEVRCALPEETFITLDGEKRQLNPDMLMICDKKKAVAIGGVMGGQNSEVSDTTQNILLEAAYFSPTNIRRTSKTLGLSSESSKRFERGCDPNNVLTALDRAAQLIQEIAGGEMANGSIDEGEHDFPEPTITCRASRINGLLGAQLAVSEIERIFRNLGYHYHWDKKDVFSVHIPTYRVDIHGEIDLIEEIARIYGYDNLQDKPYIPAFASSSINHAPIFEFERRIRRQLLGEGLQELLTCDLISPKMAHLVGDSHSHFQRIAVLNPTSVDQSVLRPSLLPGLLQVVRHNADRYVYDLAGFEIGRIHHRVDDQYREHSMAAMLLTGKSRPHHWARKPVDFDFYDIKGIVENLFEALGFKQVTFQSTCEGFFHPGRQATMMLNEQRLGVLGEVHPDTLREMDVEQRLYAAELNLGVLLQACGKLDKVEALPQFPGMERDWTLTLKSNTAIGFVLKTIEEVPSKILQDVLIWDLYKSDKLGADKQNVTFRFLYRSDKKTLSQGVVDGEHSRIMNEVVRRLDKHVVN